MKGALSSLKVPEQPAELPTFLLSGAVWGARQSCTFKAGTESFWHLLLLERKSSEPKSLVQISLLGGVCCRAEGALHAPAVLLQLQGAGKCWAGIMAALSRQRGYIEVCCDK